MTTRLVQTTLTGTPAEVRCKCGKICKNLRGLRIHQARSACGQKASQKQRTSLILGETQEDTSQEATHRTRDLSADEMPSDSTQIPDESQIDHLLELLQTQDDSEPVKEVPHKTPPATPEEEKRPRIEWPKTSNKKAWTDFDHELDLILEATLQGAVERKLVAMTSLIYTVGKERYGVYVPKHSKPSSQPNRRERQIQAIRQELKKLRKAYRNAKDEEKLGLQELRDLQRKQLRELRKAETARKNRRKRAQQKTSFIANPYKFSKKLLDKEKSGILNSSMEEIQTHLRDTHSDTRRDDPLGPCAHIMPEPAPTIALDSKEPTLAEVKDVVKKARAGSAPGPNGIPYKVYKMCPRLLRRLWRLIKVVWRKGQVPECWQKAESLFVPKETNSHNISQFRTISLLNVEGNFFFAVLARRLTTYLTANKYVDTSIQKGGVPGFSGCVEHTSALSQLIREAKVNQQDLTVVWLDLANAYGSIPHQLIRRALDHYHIPAHVQKIVLGYLDNIQLRFSVREKITEWQRLEKGIITGCTVSVVLFVMGMNLILNAAKKETRGPKTASGIYLPSNRSFMDDLTITTQTHVQARWVLLALESTTSWARMKFKPKKSRSLIIKKGQSTKKFNLQVQGEDIPSIMDMEEFKASKARLVVTLKESRDDKIRKAGIETRTGRKWSASQAVTQAESRLRQKDIVGTTTSGRQGLGISTCPRWSQAASGEKRKMVVDEVRKMEEEERRSRAVAMGSQGAWTKWDTTPRKMTWGQIWKYEPLRISFLLRSVYDLLPSPANLHRWGMQDSPSCQLCNRTGSMEHILSACSTALTQGRYRWRHDQVLRDMADILERQRMKKRKQPQPKTIHFVKEGQSAPKGKRTTSSVLDEADNWNMAVDLQKKLVFPEVVQTNLRPDIVIWSKTAKHLVMIELTIPWETRCEEAYERKKTKYSDLMDQCRQQGWRTWLFPVEIGARGFPANSLWKMLGAMGLKGHERRTAVGRLEKSAERASSWLWSRRDERSWKPVTNT
ncbi:uncharacterized protein LOC127865146 [Dreissena polymorpha]|uniref:uncharacterized protein LOC127865146 n=1 Tax=Dreissena polymorpha TaxID=45954 RepID=UPI002263C05C|nr:uncharacterized protein LOC127865146 [Dreissena polymorpha]